VPELLVRKRRMSIEGFLAHAKERNEIVQRVETLDQKIGLVNSPLSNMAFECHLLHMPSAMIAAECCTGFKRCT
jgi:hypothetical protein